MKKKKQPLDLETWIDGRTDTRMYRHFDNQMINYPDI